MQALWTRFNNALTRQRGSSITWKPPATSRQIAEFEAAVGQEFPEDFRAFLSICGGHDGEYLIAPWYFCEFNVARSEWATWSSMIEEGEFEGVSSAAEPGIQSVWVSKLWVPFVYDGGGDCHSVDLDPDESGTIGQIVTVFHDQEERRLLATGIREYLSQITVALETGEISTGKYGLGATDPASPIGRLFDC